MDRAPCRRQPQATTNAPPSAHSFTCPRGPARAKDQPGHNRGSTYYLALYWAQALAEQTDDAELQERFKPIAAALAETEDTITRKLLDAQGDPVDLGGYYLPDPAKAEAAMRPSGTLNAVVEGL